MSHISLAIKSTIDFLAKQLADEKGLPFFDIATSEFDSEIVESDKPAICWDFDNIEENPFDPLYHCSFSIGAMTLLDPSQYISLDLVGLISERFKVGQTYSIYDYSGDTVSDEEKGKMTIVQSGLAPAQQDAVNNVRFVTVQAAVVRYERLE